MNHFLIPSLPRHPTPKPCRIKTQERSRGDFPATGGGPDRTDRELQQGDQSSLPERYIHYQSIMVTEKP